MPSNTRIVMVAANDRKRRSLFVLAPATLVLLFFLSQLRYLRISISSRSYQFLTVSTNISACILTKGDWCHRWYTQKEVVWKDPLLAPFASSGRRPKPCLWNCNFVGVCDYLTGNCRCPAGWTGPACDTRMDRPCSQKYREYGSFKPYDKPFNLSIGHRNAISCAGYCDEDTGACFCPPNTTYGRIPAPMGSIPGGPPIKPGRPMSLHCQPGTVTFEDIFGKNGWCEAEKPRVTCPCILDGMAGQFCELVREQFCINQCNGRGECNAGFCKCDPGWFGHDCAYRVPGAELQSGNRLESKPWLAENVNRIASMSPPPKSRKKRPLIFVYDMHPMFDQVILQYRIDAGICVHRSYDGSNVSIAHNHVYNSETGLHEMILQSEHRTLDPNEADFFYMPTYSACMQHPVSGFGDFPTYHTAPGAARVHIAVSMLVEAHNWIRSNHPYWDRHQGRDHIVLAPHDEGPCWIPEVLRNATILGHWGYTGFNNVSFTTYGGDIFDREYADKLYQPSGLKALLGLHKCIDTEKDLIIPSMFAKSKFKDAPFISGNEDTNRTILASFKGRLLKHIPAYSRGTRQKLTELCSKHDWWNKYKIYIGENYPPGMNSSSYSDLLSRSIFCPALMGEGWSSRVEDALIHGCIPVIIMDGVLISFETALDVEQFTIRVRVKDMERLPEILSSVPEADIRRMQANIRSIWPRFYYNFRNKFSDYGNVTDAFDTIIQWLYQKLDT